MSKSVTLSWSWKVLHFLGVEKCYTFLVSESVTLYWYCPLQKCYTLLSASLGSYNAWLDPGPSVPDPEGDLEVGTYAYKYIDRLTSIWEVEKRNRGECAFFCDHDEIIGNCVICLQSHVHHTDMHTYKRTYMHAYVHIYIHTCIHTYTYTYTHTYIHA